MDRQTGFTLMDLLTTLGVATVLMRIAVPSFTTVTSTYDRVAEGFGRQTVVEGILVLVPAQ